MLGLTHVSNPDVCAILNRGSGRGSGRGSDVIIGGAVGGAVGGCYNER